MNAHSAQAQCQLSSHHLVGEQVQCKCTRDGAPGFLSTVANRTEFGAHYTQRGENAHNATCVDCISATT